MDTLFSSAADFTSEFQDFTAK